MSFKPGPEDCYGRCGSNKIWQTVPDTCSGDRESSVTDSKDRVQLTINDEDELERSRWRASTSATWQSSSVRYAGADPCRHLYARTDCLNAICSGAFSQCSWRSSGVMCWNLDEEKSKHKTHLFSLCFNDWLSAFTNFCNALPVRCQVERA